MDTSGDLLLGFLVRGRFDTGDFAAFGGVGEVVWNGVLYRGLGQVIQIGDTGVSTADGKSGMEITLSGIDPEIIVMAELEEFQRRRATVYLAVFDDEGQIVDADVYFDGLADDLESNDDPENAYLTMRCEPRSLDLQRPRPFKYLPEDQARRHPGDTFFDLVQVIQNREDLWGR